MITREEYASGLTKESYERKVYHYSNHQFPLRSFSEWVTHCMAFYDRSVAKENQREHAVDAVKLESGKTIGQLYTLNCGTDTEIVRMAVVRHGRVKGYSAGGYEVYDFETA